MIPLLIAAFDGPTSRAWLCASGTISCRSLPDMELYLFAGHRDDEPPLLFVGSEPADCDDRLMEAADRWLGEGWEFVRAVTTLVADPNADGIGDLPKWVSGSFPPLDLEFTA